MINAVIFFIHVCFQHGLRLFVTFWSFCGLAVSNKGRKLMFTFISNKGEYYRLTNISKAIQLNIIQNFPAGLIYTDVCAGYDGQLLASIEEELY